MSATHLVEEVCIGDHHGNLTGGIEAVQPPPISETVESTGPTNHSSTVLSPHSVCVYVCNDPCNFKSSKAAKPKLSLSKPPIYLAVFLNAKLSIQHLPSHYLQLPMACLSKYRNSWLSTYLLCEWTSAYLNANSISSCVKTISSSRESTASVWMLEKGRNRLLRLLRPVRTTCGGDGRRGER